MGAAVEPRTDARSNDLRLPLPVEGGTYIEEDLGRFVAWLTGALRRERRLAAEMAARYADPPADPEPVEIPAPVPGGTEPITKGGEPPAETR